MRNCREALCGCLAFVAALGQAVAAEPAAAPVIFDMDTVRQRPTAFGEDKTPAGTVELVPGRFGDACRFRFVEGARSGFFAAGVQASPQWDEAAGISFWVKGDGSSSWGGLELIDASDYTLRYGYCFPIDSTDWRKITVPWRDLIPELPAGQPVDPENGYAPSKFGNLWFGKWHYWGEYPAHSFTVDQVALEPAIPLDTTDYMPAAGGTPKTLAKLRAGQPVTIVTMGDSLSDKRHWANREVLWSERLVEKLGRRFASRVTLVNPAIGGTQLTQNLVLMPRWLREHPAPDLVTVWFGYNDWDGGMRRGQFERMLRVAVDRVRRMTGGRSEVLLMTTCPSVARWQTMDELAEAVRSVAAEKKTGLADVAAAFHREGADEAARLALYCSDRVHLGPRGHELAAETVLKAMVGESAQVVAAPAMPRPVPKEHPRLLGPRERLVRLARQRPDDYARVVRVARQPGGDDYASLISMGLVCAIEGDEQLGRQAIDLAMKTIRGPIKRGHIPFGTDLARCGLAYDLCHPYWTPEERAAFHRYMNETVDANVQSETHVFHNGWYGYKNWGIGLACYAAYHENLRAEEILRTLEEDYRTRAAPARATAAQPAGWGGRSSRASRDSRNWRRSRSWRTINLRKRRCRWRAAVWNRPARLAAIARRPSRSAGASRAKSRPP